MSQFHKALLLAAAMIGIAVLAILDIIPQEWAQYAPVALVSLFPSVWMGKQSRCSLKGR